MSKKYDLHVWMMTWKNGTYKTIAAPTKEAAINIAGIGLPDTMHELDMSTLNNHILYNLNVIEQSVIKIKNLMSGTIKTEKIND